MGIQVFLVFGTPWRYVVCIWAPCLGKGGVGGGKSRGVMVGAGTSYYWPFMSKTQMAITRLIWLARISFRRGSAHNFAAVLFGFHQIPPFSGSRAPGPRGPGFNLGPLFIIRTPIGAPVHIWGPNLGPNLIMGPQFGPNFIMAPPRGPDLFILGPLGGPIIYLFIGPASLLLIRAGPIDG